MKLPRVVVRDEIICGRGIPGHSAWQSVRLWNTFGSSVEPRRHGEKFAELAFRSQPQFRAFVLGRHA